MNNSVLILEARERKMSLYTSKGLIAKDIFNDKEISGSMIFLTVDFE